jgi:hypothetical protein
LRLAAVQVRHQELAADPLLRRLVQAVSAGREIETLRIVRALFGDRGAGRTLSDIAPMFGEILAMQALLDTNPLNDTVGWVMATGRGVMNTDPITGISTRAMTHWDTGEGAALPVGLEPGEDAAIASTGSLTAFLSNIQVIGTGGRVLIQAVIGPDDVIRHVIHAPGMHVGLPRDDSPHDLVGAFGNTIRDASPYTRALSKAIEHFGVPPGSEVALVGHSAGGVAIMNLAQDAWFCRRFTVTHAVAVGSPIENRSGTYRKSAPTASIRPASRAPSSAARPARRRARAHSGGR